jgi:transposase
MPGRKRMSHSFISYALELLKFGTIKDVADHLGVGWDLIKEIHLQELEVKYQEIPLSDVEYLSIDEFSIRKGHKYMTVISNIKTGRIIYAVEGRKQEDIEFFLQELKKKAQNYARSAWI